MIKLTTENCKKFSVIMNKMTHDEKQALKQGKFPARLIKEANKEKLVINDIYHYARLMLI